MLSVDKMSQSDFAFAVELVNTMNWNMTEADFAFNIQMQPDGCFILRENSKPIGLATCISYGKIGWFGNLIVDENHRKQGSGTRLVNHAVNYLRSVGVTTVGLYAYTHLVNFYGNVGFETNTEFLAMKAEKILCPNNSRSETKFETPKQQDIPQIIELDATCFGGSRAKLLSEIISVKGNICYIEKENDKVNGFAGAKVYEGMAEVGPMVCPRTHTKNAKSLLYAVMVKLEGSEAYAYLPSNDASLVREIGKFGFNEEFRVVRMFLGFPAQKDCIYLAESLERG